jgi:hypothetical protein
MSARHGCYVGCTSARHGLAKKLGKLAKAVLRHLTKFGEDPTSLLALCRRGEEKKMHFLQTLNSHDK